MDIDRKFEIRARARRSGKEYTEEDAVLFLAKDRAFLKALPAYLQACIDLGAAQEQIDAVKLLISRVENFQSMNETKIPDVDPITEAYTLQID